MKHSRALNQKFDYEIGYLVQSPCRSCSTYATFQFGLNSFAAFTKESAKAAVMR